MQSVWISKGTMGGGEILWTVGRRRWHGAKSQTEWRGNFQAVCPSLVSKYFSTGAPPSKMPLAQSCCTGYQENKIGLSMGVKIVGKQTPPNAIGPVRRACERMHVAIGFAPSMWECMMPSVMSKVSGEMVTQSREVTQPYPATPTSGQRRNPNIENRTYTNRLENRTCGNWFNK